MGVTAVAALLNNAEDDKLRQHARFETTLVVLEKLQNQMTSYERYWFQSVQGWDLAYECKYTDTISHLTALLGRSGDPTLPFRARGTLINVLLLANQHERAFVELAKLNEQVPAIKNGKALRQGLATRPCCLTMSSTTNWGLPTPGIDCTWQARHAACSGMQHKVTALYRTGRLTVDS